MHLRAAAACLCGAAANIFVVPLSPLAYIVYVVDRSVFLLREAAHPSIYKPLWNKASPQLTRRLGVSAVAHDRLYLATYAINWKTNERMNELKCAPAYIRYVHTYRHGNKIRSWIYLRRHWRCQAQIRLSFGGNQNCFTQINVAEVKHACKALRYVDRCTSHWPPHACMQGSDNIILPPGAGCVTYRVGQSSKDAA